VCAEPTRREEEARQKMISEDDLDFAFNRISCGNISARDGLEETPLGMRFGFLARSASKV